jgi:alkylation response protein AidB-like acyl-CoA dehydrogenase
MTDLVELETLLAQTLPEGWTDAATRGDDDAMRAMPLDGRAVIAALGRAGWTAPHWPVEHGGRNADEATTRAVYELLDRWEVPRIPRGSGLTLAAPALRAHAGEDTKRRFLPRIATGEEKWAQLFSEPGAGSDLASLSCRAERDGDEWVLNGQKVWTTLGHECEMAMTLARTDPLLPKNRGITYFAVDLHAPGVEIRPLVQMTGEHEFNEVVLTDVRIPDLFRISDVGCGWAASTTTLSHERVALSGGSSRRQKRGILGGKTIDEVLDLARHRHLTPTQRDRLARAYSDARVLGWTVQRVKGPAGSITKIAKATTNQELQLLALDILGADVTAWRPEDSEMPRYVREFLRTRANSIEGGTSEIQRNIVGERVLGLPREPDPYLGAPWQEIPRS